MKKIFTLLVLFIVTISLYAQSVVTTTISFDASLGMTDIGGIAPAGAWSRVTAGTNPTIAPQSGGGMARFNSYNTNSGEDRTIATPVIDYSLAGCSFTKTVSFWMYRDNGFATDVDSVSIYINTTASLTGATYINRVARVRTVAQPDTKATNGWYQYTFNIPSGFTGASNYIMFKGISAYGNNTFIDNVQYNSCQNVCSGTPTAGSAGASVQYLCATGNSTLSLSGNTNTPGITFQWQSSPAGANTFTNISGATLDLYNATGVAVSTDFRCVVTCSNSGISANSIPVSVVVGGVPANDLVCNAINLTLGGATDCGNTTCATVTAEPAMFCSTPNNTVWYKYTPTSNGRVGIRMSQNGTVPQLNSWVQIYTASGACPSLTLTQVDAAACVGTVNLLVTPSGTLYTPSLTAGVEYYIMVEGFSGSFGAYCINLVPLPPIPSCLVAADYIAPAAAATNVTFLPSVPNVDSFYVYINAGAPPTTATTLLGIIPASPGAVTNATWATAVGGTQYVWHVVPKNISGLATGCEIANTFTTTGAAPPPANNECAAAVAITVNADLLCAATTNGTTVNATASTETAPSCNPAGTNDDVWYKFVANSTSHTIDVTGTTQTISTQLYTGSCGSLVLVPNGCSSTFPYTITGLNSGTTYLVRVFTVSNLNVFSAFTLCVGTPPPPPANDVCTGATVIPCGGSIAGNNTFATSDVLPTITCGSTTATIGTNRAVWFSVTPTLSGSLTVSACTGTTWDTYMRVYDGTCGTFTNCLGFDDDGCGSQSTVTFTAVAGTTYYVLLGGYGTAAFGAYTISATCPAACSAPTSVSVGSITATSASVTWTGSGTNIVEYGLTGFTPGTGATEGSGGTIISPATSAQAITGLVASSAYQVYIRQNCTGAGNGFSTNSPVVAFTTLGPPPANDEAPGAITLTVGGTCTGAIYSNISATQSATEPFPSCKGTAGYAGMWYKFVAPASGSVKISCDESTGTFGDSRMALYSATNAADYTTFNIVSCDDDNGTAASTRSLFYTAGLISGTTYYILVDLYSSASSSGSYCVTVEELSSTMLSNTVTSCTADQGSVGSYNPTYTGWVSLVDAQGNLNVNVRQVAGTATSFSSSSTITSGTPRVDGVGQSYLNRNFLVSGSNATSADLQLFFLNTEATSLGGTVSGYNVTRVAGAVCAPNFSAGARSILLQTANGSANGVSYVQVNTPGFSNFYIQNSAIVLPISIEFFKGAKLTTGNYLDWKVTCTSSPTVELTLERSDDGKNFKAINTQNETATRCLQGFTYIDATPLSGANYYRLKIATPDGQFRYSAIVVILNKEKGFELISIAPNPVKDIAILTLTSAKSGKMEITISDVAGKIVSKQSIVVIAGNNPVPLNVAVLGAGTYTIAAINAEGETKTTRFVKY
jgi:hypothetical protein